MSVVCKVVIDNEAPQMFCFAQVPRVGDHIAIKSPAAFADAMRVDRVVHFARDFTDEKAPTLLIYCNSTEAKN
jgi:hypothetical protein